MIVVSDATPLIHLSKIDELHLIKRLYEKCCITQTVYDETVVEGQKFGHHDSDRIKDAIGDWLEIKDPKGDVDQLIKKHSIHFGEASSILLAKELSSLLLINERDGREVARKEGVTVKGTLGIIADGVKEEKISATSAIAMLGKFENEPNEFWLDPIIVHEAIKMISEIGKKKHDVSGDVE